MKEIEVETSIGKFKLRKPGAGLIMDAYEKAEIEWGFKKSIMIKELLPASIIEHPWALGSKVRDELRAMDITEYMKLGEALMSTISPQDLSGDLKK